MAVRKTVRIYDLAKELKQDTKRVMEELRRVGADVSVASNSVPLEFAEKLRSKYLAKAEAPVKPRQIKVIKAAKKEEPLTTEEPTEAIEVELETLHPEPAVEPTLVEIPAPVAEVPRVKTLRARPKPAAEPETPTIQIREPKEEPVGEPEPLRPLPEPVRVHEPKPLVTPRPSGTSVKILKPTTEAVRQGI